MRIEEVIRTLNQMEADGIVDRYAIGGAVAATFYLEPVATLDVDVFITFRTPPAALLTLDPILDYLKARGWRMEGEHIVIGGWPVQFLPPTGPLAEEALENSAEVDVEGIRARVFRAPYVAAIALQTGRAKDKARLLQFLEEGALDRAEFDEILTRHGLVDRWRSFQRQFLEGSP